jgi:hypothetical protein
MVMVSSANAGVINAGAAKAAVASAHTGSSRFILFLPDSPVHCALLRYPLALKWRSLQLDRLAKKPGHGASAKTVRDKVRGASIFGVAAHRWPLRNEEMRAEKLAACGSRAISACGITTRSRSRRWALFDAIILQQRLGPTLSAVKSCLLYAKQARPRR